MKKITGRPQPFGTVVEGAKVNFALRVPAGKKCELLLYREGKTRPECTFDMPEEDGIGEVRFLAVDGILDLYLNVVDGLVVYPKVIEKHLMAELPFMATENIMMDAVKAGGDRQELHERIRTLSMEAGKNVKENGGENNLLELIAADPAFKPGCPEKDHGPSSLRGTGPQTGGRIPG